MLNTRFKSSLVAFTVAIVLSACGGSSSGGGGAPATPTNVTASGIVTRFDSVFVNGVKYETTGSRVVSSDDPAGTPLLDNPTQTELEGKIGLGNILKLRGTRIDDTGTANTITLENELVGAFSDIDETALTFVVNGQTISVTPSTFIDDSLIPGINADTAFGSITPTPPTLTDLFTGVSTVEISGFPTATGLEATRIEDFLESDTGATSASDEVQIKGFVDAITTGSILTITINGLTINGLSSLPAGLEAGDLVEVRGTVNVAGTTMTATSIELEDREDLLDDDFNEGEVEVEGIIQSITPTSGTAGIIVVRSIEFTVVDISQFQVGTRIEIKAQLQNDDSLQVIRIKDEAEDNIRIRDKATAASGNAISTRLGLTVTISDRSRLEFDDGMGAGDIGLNTYIEARGFKVNNNIVWTRIEASNEDTKEECRLRGSVGASPSDPGFTIEGVAITTDGSTQFRDANNTIITAGAFFTQVAEGNIVQARSASNGTACGNGGAALNPAKEVSFEPEDDVLQGTDDNGNGGDDSELTGTISNVVGIAFVIDGETVTTTAQTMIDDSIIEDARGAPEIPNDLALGSIPEELDELLETATGNTIYVVTVDRSSGSPVATLIEDF